MVRHRSVQFYDTGHFALQTHVDEIAVEIRRFLGQAVAAPTSR
jgi:hypothetical protein